NQFKMAALLPALNALTAGPYPAVLSWSIAFREEMVSFGRNLYGVSDATRRCVLKVHCHGDETRIFEAGRLISGHAVSWKGATESSPRRSPSPDSARQTSHATWRRHPANGPGRRPDRRRPLPPCDTSGHASPMIVAQSCRPHTTYCAWS